MCILVFFPKCLVTNGPRVELYSWGCYGKEQVYNSGAEIVEGNIFTANMQVHEYAGDTNAKLKSHRTCPSM